MVILKVVIFTFIFYAETFCGTYQEQYLAIRIDNDTVYYNGNERVMWRGDFTNGLIEIYHYQ